MKLTILMVCLSLMTSLGAVYSQNSNLNFKVNNQSLKEVLSEIENQTKYSFLYKADVINHDQRVSFDITDASITEILDMLAQKANFNYKILDNSIIVLTNPTESGSQQTLTVSGKVTDSSGVPLPGVTVVVKGTTQGTITDSDGNYALANVSGNATLVFSFVGMKPQEIPVMGKSLITVTMAEETVGIDEVVAIGYGIQKKVNLTGAVSSVTSEELKARPITNMSNALSGLATGIQINQGTGQPGRDGATIRIRGIGTLGNANPLILIDGIESTMSDISPDDVESISVLKDAATAAIYGSRAANGVLLITTKKGDKGTLKTSYHGYIGIQQATRMEKYITDFATYMELNNEANVNVGLGGYYATSDIAAWRATEDPLKHPNVDWVDKVYGNTALLHSHHLSFTGGGTNNNFNLSFGYINQEGIVPMNTMERYNLRFNWEGTLIKNMTLGTNLSGSWNNINGPASTEVFGIVPGIPFVKSEDGRWGGNQVKGTGTIMNPRAAWTNNTDTQRIQRFLGKVYLNWELFEGLTLNSNFALRFYNSLSSSFSALYSLWNFNDEAIVRTLGNPQTATNANVENYTLTSYHTLNYKKALNEGHNFNILAGYSVESYRNDQFQASIQKFHNNEIRVLDGGQQNPQVSGTASEWALISYFGRLNYDFNSKYLFEANLRYDGSSRFREGKKWGVYPSFSAGWRISEESFMKKIRSIDNLKIRASWGKLGNQEIGIYPYQGVYALNQNYTFGGSVAPGIAQTTVPNPDIEWESNTSTNLGLDVSFMNGRFTFTSDYFYRETDGILIQLPIPATLGDKAPPYQNLAQVKNNGWEVSAAYNKKIKQGNFSVGFNLTHVTNEVSKYMGDVPYYSGPFVIRESLPMYSLFGYKNIGIIRSQGELDELNTNARTLSGNAAAYYITNKTAPGDLMYEDVATKDTNGDGTPDAPDGTINSEDRQVIGNTVPKYMFGVKLSADYKGFDLNVLLQGVYKVDAYLSGAGAAPFGVNGDRGQTPEKWMNRWTGDNANASLPRLTNVSGYNWNNQVSSFWMQDGSFLRLKSFQFGYSFPKTMLSGISIDQLRFYLNAENLFTFTKFPGWDPERNQLETEIVYPNLKTVSLGIQVTF
ncbi:MAG: SusC/RagA family TonB-linked outer membrane protein [Prolixibacteraceae bacterium]|nr:SusC/RagA family TonB-linked outer membrane protein [Prolixibacteraceae bacterium]